MSETAKPSQKAQKCSCRRSYVLRLWRTDEPGDFNWQASLEIPETGERIGFPDIEGLFAYLMDLTTIHKL